jgi:hypothetical protein
MALRRRFDATVVAARKSYGARSLCVREPFLVLESGELDADLRMHDRQSLIRKGTATMSEATPNALRSMALMRPSRFESGTVAGASL